MLDTKLKSGVRTSEFALTVIIAVLVQLNVLQVGNDRMKGIITGALGVAYALSRGLAKAFPPKDEAPSPVSNQLVSSFAGTAVTTGVDEDQLPHVPATTGPIPVDQGDKGSV